MKKTEQYQLCLWDPEDPVVRTDFNEDNERIDAAIHAAEEAAKTADAAVKAELTAVIDANKAAAETALNAKAQELQTTIAAVEKGASLVHLAGPVDNSAGKEGFIIDLSGVDMSQYRALLLFGVFAVNATVSCGNFSMTPYNGSTTIVWIYNTLSGVVVHSITPQDGSTGTSVHAARAWSTSGVDWALIDHLDCSDRVHFIDIYGIKA